MAPHEHHPVELWRVHVGIGPRVEGRAPSRARGHGRLPHVFVDSRRQARQGSRMCSIGGKLEFEIRIWGRSVVGWRRLRSGGGRRDPLLLTALSLGHAVHPHLPPQLRSWLAATMLFVG